MIKVTTSWDDGDVLDERIANLLDKYGLKGTFYIPRDYWGTRLSDEQIRSLSLRHEVGAHTLSHTELTKVSLDQARAEISGSKEWLDAVCNKGVEMFCYPRGRYTTEIREAVQVAGFKGARTTKIFSLERGEPFEMQTTEQVYPFPIRLGSGLHRMFTPLIQRYSGYRTLGVPFRAMFSWESTAKAAFDTALKKGEVYHLWGHSWEVDKCGLWGELENVFAYIGNRSDCEYVTNGDLI